MKIRNRIAEYYPHLWKKYLDDDFERQRQELKAATGIDVLDLVGNMLARDAAQQPKE